MGKGAARLLFFWRVWRSPSGIQLARKGVSRESLEDGPRVCRIATNFHKSYFRFNLKNGLDNGPNAGWGRRDLP